MSEQYENKSGAHNLNQDQENENRQENEHGDASNVKEKAGEYMRELLSEKIKLDYTKFPLSSRLLDEEVIKVQTTGRVPSNNFKYLDLFKRKLAKVTVKVLVPVKEYPNFNFMGKLIGPKGSTMKQLQEETMCKISVFGRGSIRDKKKEEELRNSLDPKYAHLSDELHVEISALAPPAEAHARIAYALEEVKKYLIPDTADMFRHSQMHEMMEGGPRGPPGMPPHVPPRMSVPAMHMAPGPRLPPPMRGAPGKTKVLSILDRARSAMENNSYGYEDPYAVTESPVRGLRGPPAEQFYYQQDNFYEDDYYKDDSQEFKTSVREVGTRRPQGVAQRGGRGGPAPQQRHYARAAPYARGSK